MVSRQTSRVSFALVGLTLFLMVFGSTVRVHGAGLACPDWPLCFGEVVPAYQFKVYLEFGHRVVAGIVSLIFMGLSAVLWRRGALAASRLLRTVVVLAWIALGAQVILGGLTVLELLAEWTVASHLLVGNTFCSLLLLVALTGRELAQGPTRRAAVPASARPLSVLLALLVPAQLALGGLVAGSHAGLACGTWPSCNGAGAFPTFAGLVGLQVMHRAMAYTVAGAALLLLLAVWRAPRLRAPALALVGFIALQITIGIVNVLWQLPMEVTLAHSAGAAAIMLSTTWFGFETWLAPVAEHAPDLAPLEAK